MGFLIVAPLSSTVGTVGTSSKMRTAFSTAPAARSTESSTPSQLMTTSAKAKAIHAISLARWPQKGSMFRKMPEPPGMGCHAADGFAPVRVPKISAWVRWNFRFPVPDSRPT